MHKVRWFTSNYLFHRHIRRIIAKESAAASRTLSNSNKRPRPLPASLLHLAFIPIFKLNASGSSTTYVRFRIPNPEGGFESSHQFHAQAPCRIFGRFLVLLFVEHHGFEALPDGRKSQRVVEAFPDFSGEASITLCDLPLNCNPSNTIRFSKRIDFKSNASEYP